MTSNDTKSEYDALFAASYHELVNWSAVRFCGGERDAGADFVGAAYLKGVQVWTPERCGPGGFMSWTKKVIRNLAIDESRRKMMDGDIKDAEGSESSCQSATEVLLRKELAHVEAAAINGLAEQRRRAYLLNADGLHPYEIATVLKMRPKSARNRLSEARAVVGHAILLHLNSATRANGGDVG